MPCLGNCLGSSSTGSVDLRKQSNRRSAESTEINLPKAQSYKKLRNSFLGENLHSANTSSNSPLTSTTTTIQPNVDNINTMKASLKIDSKSGKYLSKKKSCSPSSPSSPSSPIPPPRVDSYRLETHPKMIYITESQEAPNESGNETIGMEVLEPLVSHSLRSNYAAAGESVEGYDGDLNLTQPPLALGPPGMDFNMYAAKKNVSQGLVDIALLAANFSQLKFILSKGPPPPSQVDFTNWTEVFKLANLALILTSIGLQILVGIALLLSSRLNLNDNGRRRRAETCNTLIIICVFIITVINIFIVVFLDDYEEFELV